MTWVASPALTEEEATLRLGQLTGIAERAVDLLEEAAKLIADVAVPVDEEPHADGGGMDRQTMQLSADLQTIRAQLVDVCGLHKPLLSHDALNEIKEAFAYARLEGDEHAVRRKEIAEEVAAHPLGSLAELSLDEAAQLKARLREMEPKW